MLLYFLPLWILLNLQFVKIRFRKTKYACIFQINEFFLITQDCYTEFGHSRKSSKEFSKLYFTLDISLIFQGFFYLLTLDMNPFCQFLLIYYIILTEFYTNKKYNYNYFTKRTKYNIYIYNVSIKNLHIRLDHSYR